MRFVRAPEHPNRLWRIVESPLFTGFILGVIIANAVVLGLQTYPEIEERRGDLLNFLNDLFLGVFVVELALRIAAYGRRPQDFFRDGWNVFDFTIVTLSRPGRLSPMKVTAGAPRRTRPASHFRARSGGMANSSS